MEIIPPIQLTDALIVMFQDVPNAFWMIPLSVCTVLETMNHLLIILLVKFLDVTQDIFLMVNLVNALMELIMIHLTLIQIQLHAFLAWAIVENVIVGQPVRLALKDLLLMEQLAPSVHQIVKFVQDLLALNAKQDTNKREESVKFFQKGCKEL